MKTMFILTLILLNAFKIYASEEVGEVLAKGFLIKDKIVITAFDDPTIKGVSCYTTRYVRTMSLEDDSTNSSLSCRRISKIEGTLVNAQNVFSQDKGFLSIYKETVVDRFYDKKRNVLIYLSYTKSWGNKNSSHSLSVVPISE